MTRNSTKIPNALFYKMIQSLVPEKNEVPVIIKLKLYHDVSITGVYHVIKFKNSIEMIFKFLIKHRCILDFMNN